MASDDRTLITNDMAFIHSLFLGHGGFLDWLGLDVTAGVWAWEPVGDEK